MITLTMSWDILPGPGGIDNVYGPAGRTHSPTVDTQPGDRGSGREEEGTRLKPLLTQPPRAHPAERQSITHLPQNQAHSIAPHPYSPIISMVIHRP